MPAYTPQSSEPSVILYTGSNRSEKRDQALSLKEIRALSIDARRGKPCFKMSSEYFSEYLQKIQAFTHVSSFDSLSNLAQVEGWKFCPHYLVFEKIKSVFEQFSQALSSDYDWLCIIKERYEDTLRQVQYTQAQSSSRPVSLFHRRDSVFHEINDVSAILSCELQQAENHFRQRLNEYWDRCIHHVNQQLCWSDAWQKWHPEASSCKQTIYEQSVFHDHELNDWFFKPLMILHEMQHFMGNFSQSVCISLDWDGCGKVLKVSDELSPPHIFLEGYHDYLSVEQPLYIAARDALLDHMRAQVGAVDATSPDRYFHFYDDKYDAVVYDFFKSRRHLIPRGLTLVTHR